MQVFQIFDLLISIRVCIWPKYNRAFFVSLYRNIIVFIKKILNLFELRFALGKPA
jgi:hypothetical protein